MTRPALLLSLLVLLAACGEVETPIPETDLLVRVEVGVREAELGKAFPVTVTRVWEKDLEPAEWDDASLSPLVVRLEGRSLRENGVRVEETLRYRGYAFTLEDVRIPPVVFIARPRDGSAGRIVKTDALRLRVRQTLDPRDPGDPELPGPLHAEVLPWVPWARGAGLLLLLALGGVLLVRRQPNGEPPSPIVPDPTFETPAARALAALEKIRERRSTDAAALAADVAEAADVVRDYLADALAIPARERTTEEILAGSGPSFGTLLAEVLRPADRVKYATSSPTTAARDAVLDRAEAVVEASGSTAA